jgi:hypothetical protein
MEHPENNNNEEQVPSELQSLFNKLLGVTVNLKDNFDSNEMRAFIYTINILDNFVQSENNVFDTSGIDFDCLYLSIMASYGISYSQNLWFT